MDLIAISNLPWDTCFRAGVGPRLEGSNRTVVGTPEDIDPWLAPEQRADIEYEDAGGSPTNAALVFAALGGTTTVAGPVAGDPYGARVRAALAQPRVTLREITPAPDRQAHSLAFARERGERRFLATLPVLHPEARLDAFDWNGPGWLLTSAYELHDPALCRIVLEACASTQAGARRVAFDLADPDFVIRHRDAVRTLIDSGLEVLMTGPEALDVLLEDRGSRTAGEVSRLASIVLVTRGADGVEWIAGRSRAVVPAIPAPVTDTTGAGDAFLGAFLFGMSSALGIPRATGLGASAARETVRYIGARAPLGIWPGLRRDHGLEPR